jgi:hypothetical protein
MREADRRASASTAEFLVVGTRPADPIEVSAYFTLIYRPPLVHRLAIPATASDSRDTLPIPASSACESGR